MGKYLEKSKKYKGFHYRELDPEMLGYLHRRSVVMLKEVISILGKHGIQYMICGGTLLGAVTTGKFIPWDDDVDLCIFDSDYERAVQCLAKELPDGMMLQCARTERNYYHGWAKVRDRRSRTYPGEPVYKENGVWIDIYRLLAMKKNEVALSRALEHLDYLRRRHRAGSITASEYWERLKQAGLPWKLAKGKLQALFGLNRRRVCVLQSASGITLDEGWCFPVKEYEFEGLALTGFGMAERYLKEHYGEGFLELPAEEMRRVSINRVEGSSLCWKVSCG